MISRDFTVSWENEDTIKQAGRHFDNGWGKWKQMAVVITSFYVLGGELKVSSGETVTKQELAKKQKDVQMSQVLFIKVIKE